MSHRRRAVLVLTAGLALVAVSTVALLLGPTSVASFGWFAYTPLSETTYTPPGYFLGRAQLWWALAGVAGLAAASGAAGYLAGRRAERQRPPA